MKHKTRRSKLTFEQEQKIIEHYQAGYSMTAISSAHRIDQFTIKEVAKKHGVYDPKREITKSKDERWGIFTNKRLGIFSHIK